MNDLMMSEDNLTPHLSCSLPFPHRDEVNNGQLYSLVTNSRPRSLDFPGQTFSEGSVIMEICVVTLADATDKLLASSPGPIQQHALL